MIVYRILVASCLLVLTIPALAQPQKQISNYPPAASVGRQDRTLLQQGTTGTPYTYGTVGQFLGAMQSSDVTTALGYTPLSSISGGTGTSGWNVISPTNTSADATVLQAAVNGPRPVFMTRGTWQICTQISVPVNQRIEGEGGYANSGSAGASPNMGRTVVSCTTNGTFSSGQAFFALKDHDVLRGVDIYCNFGSNPQFNGVNALNALAPEIDHITVAFCKHGISRLSDANVPGASISFSQLARIHDNFFYENTGYGYFADFANGGFVSDEAIGPNNDFVLAGGSTGGIYLHFVSSVQVFNNRCEVGGNTFPCINIQQGGRISITGNNFEQTQALLLAGVDSTQVTGNYGNSDTFGALFNVEFSGANSNIQFAGNAWTGAAKLYKVDAGGSFTNSFFAEYGNAASTIYNDAYTQFVMQPITATAQSVVANITPTTMLLSQSVGNHISSRGFTPTLSSCGSGTPAVAGDDAAGTITLGGGSPTACTVTFAAPYAIVPQCTTSTNSTSSVPAISAISTSAFTVSLSATATKALYTCIEQVPSLVKGGAALTSDWSTFHSSFATSAATSPSGASDAARITEDSTATDRHYIQSTTALVGSTGTNTISAYIHAGSSGTDNVLIGAYDTGFSNTMGAVFSVVDGSYLGAVQQAGAGTIIAVGSQSVDNGWFRVWLTFTLGAQPDSEFMGLARGNNNNFSGDSTSNALVWGPAMRAGTLP